MTSLASQLPITFSNKVSVTSYVEVCPECGSAIPADQILAGVAFWGKHLLTTAACAACGAEIQVNVRIRDNKTVQQFRDGQWETVTSPASTGASLTRTVAGCFLVLSIIWIGLIRLARQINLPVKLVSWQGRLYCLTGSGDGKDTLTAVPLEGNKPVVISKSGSRKAL